MKFIAVLFAIIVAVNASANHAAWQHFKLTHSKSYHAKEEQLRFQVFQNNLRKIQEHNAKYDNGEVSYYFDVNQFADMTSEEFRSVLNKQIASKPVLNATLHEEDPNAVLAASVDWRKKAVLAVKNQGDCGSCWAFSTTGALEGQLAIHRNSRVPLSEQELVDCSTENSGCDGGNMEYAFEYVQKKGLASGTKYPYTGSVGRCRSTARTLFSISGYRNVKPNEKSLKQALSTVGPISIAVEANAEWQFYAGGIFNNADCRGTILNHGVLAVDYSSKYIIIKNSWGTSWGEKGYIRLVSGRNECGLANDASYPVL